MRKKVLAAALILLVSGAAFATYFVVNADDKDAEVRVVVSINVCRSGECLTVPVPKSDVVIMANGEQQLKATTAADGTAILHTALKGSLSVVATSPLLSQALSAPIRINPDDRAITVELTDPVPAELQPPTKAAP